MENYFFTLSTRIIRKITSIQTLQKLLLNFPVSSYNSYLRCSISCHVQVNVRLLGVHFIPGQTLGPGRTRTDKRTCLNGFKTPQVNAKCDVVIKLSVFGTRTDTYTHTRQNLYILATRAVTTKASAHIKNATFITDELLMGQHINVIINIINLIISCSSNNSGGGC